MSTIGLWGPRARDILASLTADDVTDEGFGFLTCREITGRRRRTVLASRISYVGELGWELYVPMDDAAELWDDAARGRRAHGAVPVGIGVYGTTGRIEKGYRAFGYELDAERTIVEAGMQRPKVKAADFVGREAYLEQREEAPAGRALHADRRRPHLGVRREALHARRRADPDPRRRHRSPTGTATTPTSRPPARRRRSASTCCWPTCRPSEAVIGNELAVSYMEELYPVTVGSVDATALFDPANERIR